MARRGWGVGILVHPWKQIIVKVYLNSTSLVDLLSILWAIITFFLVE